MEGVIDMFEQETPRERLSWQVPTFQQEKTTWEKIFGGITGMTLEKIEGSGLESNTRFEDILLKNLEPNLSLQELSVRVVQSALEVEYGPTVAVDMDYAKMIGVLADALRNSSEMREVMLAVANRLLRKKLNLRKKTVH